MKKSRVGARGPNLSRQAPLLKRPRASLLLLADGEGVRAVRVGTPVEAKPDPGWAGLDLGQGHGRNLGRGVPAAVCHGLSVAAVDVVPVTIRWETSLAFGNDEVRR
ncbi:hypothetical protein PoMZ_12707 [Pyricularia oryzae]|uniref:Uncharacterized protein n=1 Tax=Pyricularia oryzae TaxID=318829 RepID=A0A4P7NTA3_PYROR|nr:hypothetical protein PoMZ_12707 [Pyricularia oryzae]